MTAKLVYQGRNFSVQRHKGVEPGGIRVVRDVIHHPGSAVILPVLPDGRVLLIRQYRMAAERELWELPAGTRDRGESPSRTARRELGEETGYRSSRWKKLVSFYPSPGIISERMHLFLAEDVQAGAAHPESDERITVRAFSTAELNSLIARGKIIDGKTLVGLLYWMRGKRASRKGPRKR